MNGKETQNNPPVWVAALLDTRLSATGFRVFIYMNRAQGKHASAWPKLQTVATELGTSQSTVRRALRELAALGYIKVNVWRGRGKENEYIVTRQKPVTDDTFSGGENLSLVEGFEVENLSSVRVKPVKNDRPHNNRRIHSRTHSSSCAARKRKKPPEYTPDFERFWSEYPKKVDKMEAFKEWQAIDPDAELVEKIVLSVQAWRRSEQWAKDGGHYILYPVRFLRRRRFDDTLPCSPGPQRGDPDWLPTEEEADRLLAKVRRPRT